MKIKDRLIIIIAIIVVIILCILYPSKQVYFEEDENINNIISYSFGCKDRDNIDDILKEQKYIYTRDNYEKYLEEYLAIIVHQNNKAYLNQYKVYYTKEDNINIAKINITVPHNCDFIISLPNGEKTYEWKIKKESDLVRFNEKSNININYEIEDNDSFGRENLYFTCTNSGNDYIEVEYGPKGSTCNRVILINISII